MTPTSPDHIEPLLVPWDSSLTHSGYETPLAHFAWSLVDAHQPDRVALGRMISHGRNHWLLELNRPVILWNLHSGACMTIRAVILVAAKASPSGLKDVWLVDNADYAQRIWTTLTSFKDT